MTTFAMLTRISPNFATAEAVTTSLENIRDSYYDFGDDAYAAIVPEDTVAGDRLLLFACTILHIDTLNIRVATAIDRLDKLAAAYQKLAIAYRERRTIEVTDGVSRNYQSDETS